MAKLIAILLFFISIPFTNINAQIICTGTACPAYEQKYGPYLKNFQEKYIPVLMKDMFVANATAAFSPVPYYVNLNSAAVGAYFGAGFTDPSKVEVFDPSSNKYKRIPERGVALFPMTYAGINVGWLYDYIYNTYLDITDCSDKELLEKRGIDCTHRKKSRWSRFDVYTYGFRYGENQAYDPANPFNAKQYWSIYGVMLRFHLIEEKTINSLINLKFEGVSIGVGQYKVRENLHLTINEGNHDFQFNNNEYQWYGKSIFDYRINMSGQYSDIRTGFKIWFVGIYFGIGTSKAKGMSSFHFVRHGSITQPNNKTAEYSINIDNYSLGQKIYMHHYIAGIKIGSFGIHGTMPIGRNPYTNKRAYNVGITFTVSL